MAGLILETRGLKKYYRKQPVVNNVSLRVPRNSIYGLLGPNGAGKSTILKMVTGLIRPDEGEIIVFGEPWSRRHLKRIGALIESPAFYGNLTVFENLLLHARLIGLSKESIYNVLEIVELEDVSKKVASQLSLGMKQRLGIAIALLGNPEILILDEPTNGLDPIGIQELRKLILSFPEKGITVILSSHILTEISQTVNHVGIMSNGELKFQGAIKRSENLEELFMEVVKG
ncbi:lantibiotic ABC transporter ATP-binding protein [Thermoclostridium stercorarium subsp. thermolacticum DSM 2910]|uniref:Lantibiotic ABC transporter ATP-binding protein n=2 Tax=Thermoclostridium stercorarium TaxID=1510 RepID=A0A1B1YHB9_THEST|nr:lantibiotic protection ABC transporter ATP-binding protein [Thermoclostridium stercorarium]ANW97608.1 lantibiotic ABC transporter ATP-binding protein [Thermoclostridium stercorarium subsp. thermolacticum DSM 2910]ANX00168.1 lantibiotic ABC transporter ATP-binding protein [Thermoclostridium stercorarium subsp. leptospartum DSM 9219]UZQ85723.1 lantibiotic protection ABC transporter ATP-binding protein [Thermoclostridium stercorarium]